MKLFDARSYSISDFLEWKAGNLLDLSPKFQRRNVWTRAAKSFLVDTILRGKPMPKVLLTQDLIGQKNVRTVVDGQQRIRAILEFLDGAYAVMRTHNATHGGKRFGDLDQDTQAQILQYEIGVDLLYNVSMSDMLDIFARINTYSVTLNAQEKLNAKYVGSFKTTAYALGFEYVGYLLDGGVLTEKAVSRMDEARLASDMLIALIGGVQTVKNLEKYYRQYEELDSDPEELSQASQRFREIMQFIGAIYPSEDLKMSNWSRPPWFYTLFTCVAHAREPLVGLEDAPRPQLTEASAKLWRSELDQFGALYDKYTDIDAEGVPPQFSRFINFSQRRTSDTEPRRERAQFVLQILGQ